MAAIYSENTRSFRRYLEDYSQHECLDYFENISEFLQDDENSFTGENIAAKQKEASPTEPNTSHGEPAGQQPTATKCDEQKTSPTSDVKNLNNKDAQTTPAITTDNEEKIFQLTRGSILTFLKWHPLYVNHISKERDNCLQSVGERRDRSVTTEVKILEKAVDSSSVIAFILSSVSLEEVDKKLTKYAWMKVDRVFNNSFIRSFCRIPYPIVYLYTMDWGMKLWFSRRIQACALSTKNSRLLQYAPVETGSYVPRLIDITHKGMNDRARHLESQTDEDQLVTVYQLFSKYVLNCLSLELMTISIRRPDLHHIGLIYRGEQMTGDQFKNLHNKCESDKNFGRIKLFALGVSSTSVDKHTAVSFLSKSSAGVSDDSVKVLHTVHIITPNEEEMSTFHEKFPSSCLISKALDIKEFSKFPHESEIIVNNLFILNLCMEKGSEGIWENTSVGIGLEPFMDSKEFQQTCIVDPCELPSLDPSQENSETHHSAEALGLSQENYDSLIYWNQLSVRSVRRFAENFQQNKKKTMN